MKSYRCLLLLLLACLPALHSNAQGGIVPTNREAAKRPLWVPMLDDTTANFFEVERVFNAYFKNHELPEGEHEDIGEHAERGKFPSKRERRQMKKENDLRMDVRRFLIWKQQTEPYVQPDGRILTPSERLRIWQEQQLQR